MYLRGMILVVAGLVFAGCLPAADTEVNSLRKLPAERIWDSAPHNAFTSLIRWHGQFYCAFREGDGHVRGDGRGRVIVSSDGHNWRSVTLLEKEGVDLRDPKLSVTPDGRLMILVAGSYYAGGEFVRREMYAAFLDRPDGDASALKLIQIDPSVATNTDWLWRVSWDGDTGYGVVYQHRDEPWRVQLVKTQDGVHYQLVTTLDVPGKPNESTIRFLRDGHMAIVVRNEQASHTGSLGLSESPFTKWSWQTIPYQLGGPDFLQLPDGDLILGTRLRTTEGAKMVLGKLALDGSFTPRFLVPSGGDTSYPGLLIHDEQLWVSYYSSHEDKTSIYLARIPLSDLK